MDSIKRTSIMIGFMVLMAALYFVCDRGDAPAPRLRGTRINEDWYCYL